MPGTSPLEGRHVSYVARTAPRTPSASVPPILKPFVLSDFRSLPCFGIIRRLRRSSRQESTTAVLLVVPIEGPGPQFVILKTSNSVKTLVKPEFSEAPRHLKLRASVAHPARAASQEPQIPSAPAWLVRLRQSLLLLSAFSSGLSSFSGVRPSPDWLQGASWLQSDRGFADEKRWTPKREGQQQQKSGLKT